MPGTSAVKKRLSLTEKKKKREAEEAAARKANLGRHSPSDSVTSLLTAPGDLSVKLSSVPSPRRGQRGQKSVINVHMPAPQGPDYKSVVASAVAYFADVTVLPPPFFFSHD
jgi:hypothetical protein